MTPKFRLKGAGFLENNFKNLKALLKNILHVKGSEGILDFKGTKLIWAEASALQGLLYTYK